MADARQRTVRASVVPYLNREHRQGVSVFFGGFGIAEDLSPLFIATTEVSDLNLLDLVFSQVKTRLLFGRLRAQDPQRSDEILAAEFRTLRFGDGGALA